MKKSIFKKSTYLQGAFVATFGIVLSKILGMIYVIPFYSTIGTQGGALYGYAYNIYSIFLSISTAGIPLAISSITSEYNTLGFYDAKERTFRIARRYLNIVGVACFLIVFIFAKEIAYLIIGDISGGNSIDDISFVIRVISFSILIVPTLSVYRGYLQGHKYIAPTSVSQVLEQFIRVTIIIVGSWIAVNILQLPIKFAVSTALFGATIGALISLIYLIFMRKKYRHEIKIDEPNKDEVQITNQMILKRILWCAFPFIFCDVCKSLYNSVDTFFVVKTLVHLGYDVGVAETVMGTISTWGNKLNMIVVAIGTGFAVSLIPNLAASLALKNKKDAEHKINLTLQSLGFLTIPMTCGLSFLSVPVWNILYGANTYGPLVFRFSIVVAIMTVFLSSTQIIALALKEYKMLFVAVLSGLLFNGIFDVPLMYLCHRFTYAFYGAILSTCLGHLLTITIVLLYIKKKHNFKFTNTPKNVGLSFLFTIIMLIGLKLLSFIVPLSVPGRLTSCFIVLFYAIVGAIIYLFLTYKFHVIENIFGNQFLEKIKSKLLRKKEA